jgi:hypothetical protein
MTLQTPLSVHFAYKLNRAEHITQFKPYKNNKKTDDCSQKFPILKKLSYTLTLPSRDSQKMVKYTARLIFQEFQQAQQWQSKKRVTDRNNNHSLKC